MSTATENQRDPALRHYEHLANVSGKMVELAQKQDWLGVVSLSQQYHDAVEALRLVPDGDTVDAEARHVLLTKILSNDAKLRELTMPELARLGNMMGNLKRQQSLHRTYGPHQAS
jgi:flagellar protein FliT